MTKKPQSGTKGEAGADAWSRFERTVDVVMKASPKHRTAKKPIAPKCAKKAAK